jgi:hypothetical protein
MGCPYGAAHFVFARIIKPNEIALGEERPAARSRNSSDNKPYLRRLGRIRI